MDNNNTIFVGDKFYKTIDNKTVIVRVVKINNSKITVSLGDNKFNISNEILLNDYTKLRHHGSIFFSIVSLQGDNKDVMISFFRRDDEGHLPYAVCRQNMENIFMSRASLMREELNGIFYLGVSMSQDTCPEDIDYNMILTCSGVCHSQRINIYMDDTFEDICNLIQKQKKYDDILSNLYDKTAGSHVQGVSRDIISLMKDTIFMGDVMKGFGIYILQDIIEVNGYQLAYEQKRILEKELNVEMKQTYVVPFDYTVNIHDIKRSYVLVKDMTERLHIVAYDKGDYIKTDIAETY